MKTIINMKTIIKILLIIFTQVLFLQLPNYTFAETGGTTDIKLEILEKKVDINDTFNINFSVNLGSGNDIGEVKVEGIDKFYNLGQSSAFNFQRINGESKSIYNMTIKLKPIETGKFTIGPVSLKNGDKTLKSDTVEIEVIGGVKSKLSQSEDKELTLEDINDINGPKNTTNFSFGFIIIFFVILFFIGFYYLFRYYNNLKREACEESELIESTKISKNQYFLDKLNDLKDKSETYNKSEFFSLLNDLLREFLEFKGLIGARNMTFKELERNKKLIDSELFAIIKDTYFEEFKKDDSELDRTKILKEIKNKLHL
ncbi:hypothetical protein EOM39_06625 [Candidatus Gracilibacteria bacterium]|nr:hypothetical protein [Candidatus Gracilibacteria bacterium]